MRTFSAADAKNRFGELLDAAQREPVRIEKHGRATAVMISEAEYAELAFQVAEIERYKIEKGLADLDAGRTVDGATFFDDLKSRLAK
ncbi:type II toxin-antitoxin system Phd/YefM family antitoxin [Hyphobacterium sp. SN044]|uniref:type II toxin-antitoxin system Phd/YefM family antitoxin n=1 Tax=Hyphobacterium sp. SN044 TaxID=2912575 RepID=UPI001F409159|nr:type II toxin-antitoxin system prevent-host-death family antitoxin [Hyphobacterium sp. SN044]MCF8878702.1 type II toxin-antitoxin system Phd/YefM family antitoxin [Hyphobacterium sp. SN044]